MKAIVTSAVVGGFLYSPVFAESIAPERAVAIHECNVKASVFLQHTWGDWQLYAYRACMAELGQQE